MSCPIINRIMKYGSTRTLHPCRKTNLLSKIVSWNFWKKELIRIIDSSIMLEYKCIRQRIWRILCNMSHYNVICKRIACSGKSILICMVLFFKISISHIIFSNTSPSSSICRHITVYIIWTLSSQTILIYLIDSIFDISSKIYFNFSEIEYISIHTLK